MQNLFRVMVVAAMVLAAGSAGLAHEGHVHKALGTVVSVSDTQLEIKTTAGKALKVTLDGKTTVTRDKVKTDIASITAGERIAVDYNEVKGVQVAAALRLGK